MAPGGMSGGPPPGPGGDEVKLGDVKWGKIFKMGWKIVGYSKYLALLYCVMTLLQNGLNLSTAQLMGEVTKSLSGRNNPVVAPAPDSASTTSTASTTIPAIVAPVPQKEAESSILPPRGTKKIWPGSTEKRNDSPAGRSASVRDTGSSSISVVMRRAER